MEPPRLTVKAAARGLKTLLSVINVFPNSQYLANENEVKTH